MSSVMQIAFLLVALLAWSVKGHRDVAIQPQTAPSGQVRTYFIAADEVDWEYAPSRTDQVHGEPYHFQVQPGIEGHARPQRDGVSEGAVPSPAQQSPGGSLDGVVDAIAEAAVRELHLPSLSIAIARGSRVLRAKAYSAGRPGSTRSQPASGPFIGSARSRSSSRRRPFSGWRNKRKLSLDDEIPRNIHEPAEVPDTACRSGSC